MTPRLHPHSKSPDRQQVEQAIRDAGKAGMTRAALTESTGLAPRRVGSILHNIGRGDAFVAVQKGKGRTVHLAREHYAAHMAAHPARPNLPARATTVTAITKAQPRNSTVSRDRLNLERALPTDGQALSPAALSIATGVELQKVRRIMQTLRDNGQAVNVGTPGAALWRAVDPKARRAAPPVVRFCNSSAPTMRPSDRPSMICPRADADQHLQVPSLGLDGRRPYVPPLIIGSGIAGGMR